MKLLVCITPTVLLILAVLILAKGAQLDTSAKTIVRNAEASQAVAPRPCS